MGREAHGDGTAAPHEWVHDEHRSDQPMEMLGLTTNNGSPFRRGEPEAGDLQLDR